METGTAKRFRRGTHRVVSPADTVQRFSHLRAPMGITRLANITGLDNIGISVVQSIRPNSRSISVEQGGGLDLHSAAASALMASIEGHHAESIDIPLRLGPWAELRHRHRLADVSRMVRVRDSRLDPGQPLLWCAARNLVDRQSYLVPFEAVNTDLRLPVVARSGCFVMSPNGLAAGNDIEEATLHGLCELIERDAVTLAAVDPYSSPRVDMDSIDVASCTWLIERFVAAGLDVTITDITSDLGIACYCVRVVDQRPASMDSGRDAMGAGCHPSAEVALCRALTKAARARVAAIAGAREDRIRADHSRLEADPPSSTDTQTTPGVRCRFRDRVSLDGDTIGGDLDRVISVLREAGFEQVLVIDLTKSEIRIPVVKVVVPGLEMASAAPLADFGQRARARAEAASAREGAE